MIAAHLTISCMAYFQDIYHSDLSHRARAVYMYLKDHVDSEGRCRSGIRTIAAELGLSRSTVKRALDDLYGAGLLTRELRWRRMGVSVPIYTGWCEFKIKDPPPGGDFALAVDRG